MSLYFDKLKFYGNFAININKLNGYKMNLKYYFLTGLCTASLLGLSSCFDDNYDLSDIDTTAKIELSELTIPLKLDKVTLDKALDIKEGSQIKVIDGKYAVLEEGTFKSSKISIPSFNATAPNIENISASLSLNDITNMKAQIEALIKGLKDLGYSEDKINEKRAEKEAELWNAIPDDNVFAIYKIENKNTTLSTTTNNVDKSVRAINNIGVSSSIKVTLSIDDVLKNIIDNVKIYDLKIQMPKGLTIDTYADCYDKNTGMLDLSSKDIAIKDGKFELSFNITDIANVIDGNENEDIKFVADKNGGAGSFTFSSTISASGSVSIMKNNFKSDMNFFDLPDVATYYCAPEMGEIKVNTFSGKIKYDIDPISVRSIDLKDIPDVLNGDDVNVVLSNPQIYLTLTNPLSDDNLKAEANLRLIPEKNGEKRSPITQNIEANSSDNMFCFSPANPSADGGFYKGFEAAKYEEFAELKNIVSGKGLPDKISVEVNDPRVPEQEVTDFALGRTFNEVEGKYTFYAPMALDEGTLVIYNDVMDGWSDETLEKTVITGMKVEAKLDTDVPVNAKLILRPINSKGQIIDGVDFDTVTIEANKKDQSFLVNLKNGTIKDLDGISFSITIYDPDKSSALSKVQYIQFKDMKVTVSGYYQDEL